MNKRTKPWLYIAVAGLIIMTLLPACGTANQQNENAPSRTEGPETNSIGPNNDGVNDGPNDGWNNAGTGARGRGIGQGMNNAGPDNDGVGTRGNAGTRTNGNMRLADNIADKLSNRRDIENATVMLSDDNAFIAIDMPGNEQGQITNDLKKSISRDVKKMDKSIDNVFVSADVDFFDRMDAYAEDIRNGKPIGGMVDQVTETLRRIFPTAY